MRHDDSFALPIIPIDPACIAIPVDGRNGPALYAFVYEDESVSVMIHRVALAIGDLNHEE